MGAVISPPVTGIILQKKSRPMGPPVAGIILQKEADQWARAPRRYYSAKIKFELYI